jgi:hypothetical protein
VIFRKPRDERNASINAFIVWDIETVPDLKGYAAANGHDGKGYDEIRAASRARLRDARGS